MRCDGTLTSVQSKFQQHKKNVFPFVSICNRAFGQKKIFLMVKTCVFYQWMPRKCGENLAPLPGAPLRAQWIYK